MKSLSLPGFNRPQIPSGLNSIRHTQASPSANPLRRTVAADTCTIRFGSNEVQNPDAKTIAVLDSLVPRLNEAQNWQMLNLQDKYGNMTVGTDLKFQIGDTRYNLRDIFEDKESSLPTGLKSGCVLFEEGPNGSKEYPMDYENTFIKYWPAFIKTANPIMAARTVADVLKNADKITQSYYSGHEDGGVLIFKADGHNHRLDWNSAEGTYKLSEDTSVSSEQIEQYWKTTTDFRKQSNAKRLASGSDREPTEIDTLEAFTEKYNKHWRRSNRYPLTQEQFNQVFNAIKGDINTALTEKFGLGNNFNPRPILRTIATRLLKDPEKSGVGYRLHDETDEVTFYPTAGQADFNHQTDVYFEVAKHAERKGDGYHYWINAREGNPSTMRVAVKDANDIALLEKLLEIVKVKNEEGSIEMEERLFRDVAFWKQLNPNFQPKDMTQQKQALKEEAEKLLGELNLMLPLLADG